jgi:hypothetical protein
MSILHAVDKDKDCKQYLNPEDFKSGIALSCCMKALRKGHAFTDFLNLANLVKKPFLSISSTKPMRLNK